MLIIMQYSNPPQKFQIPPKKLCQGGNSPTTPYILQLAPTLYVGTVLQ